MKKGLRKKKVKLILLLADGKLPLFIVNCRLVILSERLIIEEHGKGFFHDYLPCILCSSQ